MDGMTAGGLGKAMVCNEVAELAEPRVDLTEHKKEQLKVERRLH